MGVRLLPAHAIAHAILVQRATGEFSGTHIPTRYAMSRIVDMTVTSARFRQSHPEYDPPHVLTMLSDAKIKYATQAPL